MVSIFFDKVCAAIGGEDKTWVTRCKSSKELTGARKEMSDAEDRIHPKGKFCYSVETCKKKFESVITGVIGQPGGVKSQPVAKKVTKISNRYCETIPKTAMRVHSNFMGARDIANAAGVRIAKDGVVVIPELETCDLAAQYGITSLAEAIQIFSSAANIEKSLSALNAKRPPKLNENEVEQHVDVIKNYFELVKDSDEIEKTKDWIDDTNETVKPYVGKMKDRAEKLVDKFGKEKVIFGGHHVDLVEITNELSQKLLIGVAFNLNARLLNEIKRIYTHDLDLAFKDGKRILDGKFKPRYMAGYSRVADKMRRETAAAMKRYKAELPGILKNLTEKRRQAFESWEKEMNRVMAKLESKIAGSK